MADKYVDVSATYCGDGTTSAQAPGSTVTITIASPGVVTWTGHTRVANDPVYFSTTGALPTGLTAGTKYYVRNPGTNTFEVSATSGGASINTSGTQSGTHTCRGVGAWNQLCYDATSYPFGILRTTALTFGSLDAGDVVHIRTKNGANNLSETQTNANMTAKNGTQTAPIEYRFDDGTVWAGDSGLFTLTLGSASTGRQLAMGDWNRIIGKNKNFKLYTAYTAGSVNQFFAWKGGNYIEDVEFESASSGSSGTYIGGGDQQPAIFNDVLFDVAMFYNNYPLIIVSGYTQVKFINCWFDFTGATASNVVLFTLPQYGGDLLFQGGGIIGGNEASWLCLSFRACPVRGLGFDPGPLKFEPQTTTIAYEGAGNMEWADIPGGVCDFVNLHVYGRSEWRAGQNFPVANAILPDADSTPWSYKVHATRAATGREYQMPTLVKRYEGTAATKTITANLLINTTTGRWPSPTKDRIWMDVQYIDNSTGKMVIETTRLRTATALDTASGVWDTTVYGAETFGEFKFSLTTSGSIQDGSTILVTLWTDRTAANSNDFIFVDPEIVLS